MIKKYSVVLLLAVLFICFISSHYVLSNPDSIDVGVNADNYANSWDISYGVPLQMTNPANNTGNITYLETQFVLAFPAVNMTVGLWFNVSGTVYECRDTVYLGDVTDGSKQTFYGIELDVETGDRIGAYFSSGLLEREGYGFNDVRAYSYNGSGYYIGLQEDYTIKASNDCIALYGTGSTDYSGLPYAPTNLILTQVGVNTVNASWTQGILADDTILIISTNKYQNSPTDNFTAYSGNNTSCLIDGLSLDLNTYFISAFSENDIGYSLEYTTASIGGSNMIQLGAIIIGIGLFFTGFIVKRGLIWAIPLGYHALLFYFAVINEWDVYYFIPIGGFTIICLIVFTVKMFKGDLI